MEEALQYHMRLRVYKKDRNFGPGVSCLMQLVDEKGSLSAACKEMKMSYSKAWRIINGAESDLGFPLMEGSSGGESGGSTVLTEEGRTFLERYLLFEREVQQQADGIFHKYFGETAEKASLKSPRGNP